MGPYYGDDSFPERHVQSALAFIGSIHSIAPGGRHAFTDLKTTHSAAEGQRASLLRVESGHQAQTGRSPAVAAVGTRHSVSEGRRATLAVETTHPAATMQAPDLLNVSTLHNQVAGRAGTLALAVPDLRAEQRAAPALASGTVHDVARVADCDLLQVDTRHAVVHGARPTLDMTVTGLVASKDSWVPTTSGCVDNANKNGTDLQISSLSSGASDAYIGWNLAMFPAGAVVTSAKITFRIVSFVDAVGANRGGSIAFFGISQANESWGEATLTCSNRPAASGSLLTSGTFPSTPGDITMTLNAATLAYLTSRMGVATATLLVQVTTAERKATLEDNSSAGLGARLELTFTVP